MQVATIRERYLRDELPIRLGGLAANLARIVSFAGQPHETGKYPSTVEHLLEESEWFIEWNGPDAPLETQTELVELQIQLAVWRRDGRSGGWMKPNAVRRLRGRVYGQTGCWNFPGYWQRSEQGTNERRRAVPHFPFSIVHSLPLCP